MDKTSLPKLGDKVYQAGDAWSYTELVTVTENNIDLVHRFWGSIYHSNEKDANEMTSRAHADYNDWIYNGGHSYIGG